MLNTKELKKMVVEDRITYKNFVEMQQEALMLSRTASDIAVFAMGNLKWFTSLIKS